MMTSLNNVGFATISERRASQASIYSPLERCALVVTEQCNLRCVYCNRTSGEHLPLDLARTVVDAWVSHGLQTIMLSGGEPTLHPDLDDIVGHCADHGLKTIILATNGTAPLDHYARLIERGVTELSVSIDSGESARGATIHGAGIGVWDRVVATISGLSPHTRLVTGLVLNEHNAATVLDDLRFIDSLGPADIKLTPSSHYHDPSRMLTIARAVPGWMLERYTFLRYRLGRLLAGGAMKTLQPTDSHHCWLGLDDMAVAGGAHYPCYIYQREGGAAIGRITRDMDTVRQERFGWILTTDTHRDPICARHCIDFYIDYNNRVEQRMSR